MNVSNQISEKIMLILKETQELTHEEVEKIDWDGDLMTQVGFDSLQAFNMVTTLHEMMEAELPEGIDPSSITSVNEISKYIIDNYDRNIIDKIILKSDEEIKEMLSTEDDFDDL